MSDYRGALILSLMPEYCNQSSEKRFSAVKSQSECPAVALAVRLTPLALPIPCDATVATP